MAEPSTPGSYVGQYQNGYYWTGTSWDQGETVSGTTTPTVPKTPAASSTSSKRPSILSTIMRIESGGKNIPQQIDDINMRNGDPAQGFYQITGGTWRDFGGDKTGHKSALDAPYGTQLQVAQNIPVERWGPATQEALKRAGYEAQPGETLGQMLARYNEDPTATRPEDVGGSSGGGTAVAAAAPPSPTIPGLLTAPTQTSADVAAAGAQQTAQQKASAALVQQGMGLLGQGTTAPAAQPMPAAPVHRPQAQPVALPDFMQVLAQQRLKQGQGGV
jgi:hypothetical protein